MKIVEKIDAWSDSAFNLILMVI